MLTHEPTHTLITLRRRCLTLPNSNLNKLHIEQCGGPDNDPAYPGARDPALALATQTFFL